MMLPVVMLITQGCEVVLAEGNGAQPDVPRRDVLPVMDHVREIDVFHAALVVAELFEAPLTDPAGTVQA